MTSRRAIRFRPLLQPAAVLLLALQAVLAGCKGEDSPAAQAVVEAPAATPEAALKRLIEGLVAGDETALNVVRADAAVRDGLKAGMEFGQAAAEFRTAFVAAYGKEAWEKFQDESHKPGHSNATLDIPDPEDHKQATIDEKGDEAFATVPSSPMPIRLIRVEGGWLVDGASFVPPGADATKMAQVMRSMALAVRKYKKAIGKPNITPDDIDVELAQEFAEAIAGWKPTQPRRFDVDKL